MPYVAVNLFCGVNGDCFGRAEAVNLFGRESIDCFRGGIISECIGGGQNWKRCFFAIESIGCLSGGPKQSPFWQKAVGKAEAVNLDISYRVESVNLYGRKASIVPAGAEV